MFKDPLSYPSRYLRYGFLQLRSDRLTLERLDRVRIGSSGHDDESHNGCLGSHLLQAGVET